MSYESTNTLSDNSRLADVREFLEILGYSKLGRRRSKEFGTIEEYSWHDARDYRSWSGIGLSIFSSDRPITVHSRTLISRSYFDLQQQNRTISQLRKRFGGTFSTDEGANRYLHPAGPPPSPAASGCHLAFERLGFNLIRAQHYHESRAFSKTAMRQDALLTQIGLSPRLLSNNILLPFIVAALEDYFKSTFVALLKYSDRKHIFLKNVRLQGEQVGAIFDGRPIELQVAETFSFQKLPTIVANFKALEPKLDIGGALKRPFRRRRESLYELIEKTILARHNLIHRVDLDATLTDDRVQGLIHDMDAAITRTYKHIAATFAWDFERGWHLGRRPRRTSRRDGERQGSVMTGSHAPFV